MAIHAFSGSAGGGPGNDGPRPQVSRIHFGTT